MLITVAPRGVYYSFQITIFGPTPLPWPHVYVHACLESTYSLQYDVLEVCELKNHTAGVTNACDACIQMIGHNIHSGKKKLQYSYLWVNNIVWGENKQ